jgi:Ser/Thr protein kinase RdoA (MazF antagonist)
MSSTETWERVNEPVALHRDWLQEFLSAAIGPRDAYSFETLGGLVNSNYKILYGSDRFFLRIVTGSVQHAEKELALLPVLQERGVPVPKTIECGQFEDYPVVLQEWIEGESVKSVLGECSAEEVQEIGESVGETVQKVAAIKYRQHGFLDERAHVAMPFSLDEGGYAQYITEAMRIASKAMCQSTVQRVEDFVRANVKYMNTISGPGTLVHGDFHGNNILVGKDSNQRWHVTGVVDWESAFSWNSCHDLAHVLRRDMPQKAEFERGLLQGAGPLVPDDWPVIRDLVQLLGWVDKLAAEESRTNVINSARCAIEKIALHICRSIVDPTAARR